MMGSLVARRLDLDARSPPRPRNSTPKRALDRASSTAASGKPARRRAARPGESQKVPTASSGSQNLVSRILREQRHGLQPSVTLTRSSSPVLTSGSSVSGSISAASMARSRFMPSAIRLAQATSRRVEAPSSRSCPFSARNRPARRTSVLHWSRSRPVSREHDGRLRPRASDNRRTDGDETLARRRLERLQHRLVAGVIGDHQHEIVGRVKQFAGAVERQDAAVVGERMQHHRHVLARLDHFVEIADAAAPHRAGERAVGPDGFVVLDEIAAGQVGGGEIVVAGDGVEVQARAAPPYGRRSGSCRSRSAP